MFKGTACPLRYVSLVLKIKILNFKKGPTPFPFIFSNVGYAVTALRCYFQKEVALICHYTRIFELEDIEDGYEEASHVAIIAYIRYLVYSEGKVVPLFNKLSSMRK